jgi:hypothetical protein
MRWWYAIVFNTHGTDRCGCGCGCIALHVVNAYSANNQYWQVNLHDKSPRHVRSVVATMMLLRIVEHQPSSILMLLPNEIMFELFSFIPWFELGRPRIEHTTLSIDRSQ